MRKAGKVVLSVLGSVALIGFAGLGVKTYGEIVTKQKDEKILQMERAHTNLTNEYALLQQELEEIYADGETNPGVTTVGDGSGNLTLNSVQDKIKFEQSLVYPDSKTVTANSYLTVVDGVTVSAKDTWVTKVYNSTLELEHESGISGILNMATIDYYMTDGTIKDNVLEPWLSHFSDSTRNYSNIFIGSNINGTQCDSNMLIDGKESNIKCGAFTYGQMAITYVFTYEGKKDNVKDELIKNVLNTVTVYGETITVE